MSEFKRCTPREMLASEIMSLLQKFLEETGVAVKEVHATNVKHDNIGSVSQEVVYDRIEFKFD